MDFTERMLERNRLRNPKLETKEGSSAPLREVKHNTVTTVASTSVNFNNKINSGNSKVTIETKVTMSKLPLQRISSPQKKDVDDKEETTSTEVEDESSDDKENENLQNPPCILRQDTKSRLQRLGVLYSDDPTRLSSPIHRTEQHFFVDEDIEEPKQMIRNDNRSSGRSARLAALAETINHWEDDPRHIPLKKPADNPPSKSSMMKHSMFTNKKENLQHRKFISPRWEKEISESSRSPPKDLKNINTKCRRQKTPEKTIPSILKQQTDRRTSPQSKTVKSTKTIVWDKSVIDALEAQGFSHAEPDDKIVYNYDRKDETPSVSNYVSPKKISPQKSPIKSPLKSSPVKDRYCSPIQMGTSVVKGKDKFTPHVHEVEVPPPTMGVKQLRSSPRKLTSTPPSGSVLDRAQRYEEATSPTKRSKDPAELPLAERMALFERNAGPAVLPKAPFAMAVPASKLQGFKPPLIQKPPLSKPLSQSSVSTGSLHDRLAAFERGADSSGIERMKDVLSERQKELEMLRHKWHRNKALSDPVEEDLKPSAPPPSPPPLPSPPSAYHCENRKSYNYYEEEEDEEDKDKNYLKPQISSPPEEVYPVLKEVKKVKLSPPKPGHLYPNLSDIEVESETPECELDSSRSTDNNRSTSTDASNESDLHSLGQDIVKISRSSLKRDWSYSDGSRSEAEGNEIDDFLDEALENSSDEPTPPKRCSYSTLKPPSPTKHIQLDPSGYATDDSIERMEEELDRELKLVEEKINQLQQEVIKQQTYISQASQALNLCYSTIEFSGSTEQLEAEKLLLLASQRRQAALREIQRLRVEQTLRPQAPGNERLTERGSLTISEITLPLKMDVIHQAAKDDQCYYILCLVHNNEEVLCSDVMGAPRSLHSHNKITFPNTFTLNNLYSDFTVTIEIYTMTARNKELIPHDVKYHINTSKKEASKLKLTPRKGKCDSRLLAPPVQSPGGPSAVRTSAFSQSGFVIFSLREIHRKQFTLNKVAYTSVLQGSMQLKIETEMSVDVVYRGFLTMFEDISGFGAWHRRWCLLKGDKLSYWKYPDDEGRKIPLDTIELTNCITKEVDIVPDICSRLHTFLLEISRPAQPSDSDSLVMIRKGDKTIIRHLLSADTKEERIQWCQHLNKALALIRAWNVSSVK